MAPKIITVIGSLNTDLVTTTSRVPAGGETITASAFSTGPGGKGANQAVSCARMTRNNPASSSSTTKSPDVLVKMVGAVGSDSFGVDLLSGLSADFIDVSGVQTVRDQTTGVAVILVEEKTGENRILITPGANFHLQPDDYTVPESLGTPLPDLIVLQLEIPIQTVLKIISTAKQAGVPVLLNPAPAVPLPDEVFANLNHLIINESEAAIMSGKLVSDFEKPGVDWGAVTDSFLQRGVKNVVVTLGSKGAYFSNEVGKGGLVEAATVSKVVDTTAAGDTFCGAYAVECVRAAGKWDMAGAVKWACKAAGKTVEKTGAQSAIPWLDEVDN